MNIREGTSKQVSVWRNKSTTLHIFLFVSQTSFASVDHSARPAVFVCNQALHVVDVC